MREEANQESVGLEARGRKYLKVGGLTMSKALEDQEREAWDQKVWGPLMALARIVLDGGAEGLN